MAGVAFGMKLRGVAALALLALACAEPQSARPGATRSDTPADTVRGVAPLRDPHVVTHELLHLIGFGHSMSWPTVSVPSSGRAPRLTPQDVAYVQLAIALRRSGRRIGFPRIQ